MSQQQLTILDQESNETITFTNPNFMEPVMSNASADYVDNSCIMKKGTNNPTPLGFKVPAKPTEEYQLAMWDTIDKFEQKAWSTKNVGIKTGFPLIDDAFDGGLFPGFILIGGDSNLGKTSMISQLAWNVVQNNPDVYVMDFSLDDAMADKLSRVAACSSRIIINSVKTPLNYTQYPLMLARRKQAILDIRSCVDRYIAYDTSTCSSYIEDIQKEIESKLIYFEANGIKKKLVVFIDNFHDMNIANKPNLTDKQKYDEIAQWCADLAIKHDIPIICTAEFKKLNGARRPQPDDLRELNFVIANH